MQRHLPIKRALSLGAAILLGAWVMGMLLQMQAESRSALHDEARSRAQALVSYAARDMKRWLKEENNGELERLARELAAEPEIFDVTLYDRHGIPLAQSQQALPLESLLPIGSGSRTMPAQGKGRSQYVQEIVESDQPLGYLRITLEQQQMLAERDGQLKVTQEKQRLLLLVALLSGLLLSYGIRRNYRRVRKHKKITVVVPPATDRSGP